MKKTGCRGWSGIKYVWMDWEHSNECDNLSGTIRYRDIFKKLAGWNCFNRRKERDMFSYGMAMKLRPGAYDEYKKAHDDPWPSLAAQMHKQQISMAIYKLGDNLIVHAVAPTEALWQASRQGPELDRWHEYMATLLETDDEGSIIFEELPRAFVFGMFAE